MGLMLFLIPSSEN